MAVNTLSISKKLTKTAEERLIATNGKLKYGFAGIQSVIDSLTNAFRESTVAKQGTYRVYVYSDLRGYRNPIVKCTAIVKNGRIMDMEFERDHLGGGQIVWRVTRLR